MKKGLSIILAIFFFAASVSGDEPLPSLITDMLAGKIDSWMPYGSVTSHGQSYDEDPHPDSYRIERTGSCKNPIGIFNSNSFNLLSGHTYHATIWIYITEFNTTLKKLTIDILNFPETGETNKKKETTVIETKVWEENIISDTPISYSFDFTLDQNYNNCRMAAYFSFPDEPSPDSGIIFYFDDVSLTD